jgi:hypothetical protein
MIACSKREVEFTIVYDAAGKVAALRIYKIRITAVNPSSYQPAVFKETQVWECTYPLAWSLLSSIPEDLSSVDPQERTLVRILIRRWIAGSMVEQVTNFLYSCSAEFPKDQVLALIESLPKDKTAGLVRTTNERMQKRRTQQHSELRTMFGGFLDTCGVSFFGVSAPFSEAELICTPLLTVEGAQILLAYMKEVRQMALTTPARVSVPTLTAVGGALPVSFHVSHATLLPGTPKEAHPDRKRRICFADEIPVPPTPQAAAPPAAAPPVPAKAKKEQPSYQGAGKRLTFEDEPQVPMTPQPAPPPAVAPPAPIKEGKRLRYEDTEEEEPKPKRARKEKVLPVFEKMQLRERKPKK